MKSFSPPRKLISECELRMIVLHAFMAGVRNHDIANINIEDMVRKTAENAAGFEIAKELDITSRFEREFNAKHRAAS